MIIHTNKQNQEDDLPALIFNQFETHIGGKLMIAQLSISQGDTLYRNEQDIKYELATKLAEGMIKNQLIHFTRTEHGLTGCIDYKARCYLAESGDVKILRTTLGL